MIIKPRIKGFVCITAHPMGCLENVRKQADCASKISFANNKGPKKVLVIGSSTGYGLASRISAAFGNNASSLGVSFEREPKEDKPGSAGFYNIAAFQKLAKDNSLVACDINGDAFSDECKNEVIEKAKEMGGGFDLVIYSLASPRRTDPSDGQVYRACLKPVGMIYKNKTLDTDRKEVKEVIIDPASDAEIAQTEKVMGVRTGLYGHTDYWRKDCLREDALILLIHMLDLKSLGLFIEMEQLEEPRLILKK